jgi:hypothetical protein
LKVGILTFHRSINYGAFLQCYALVTRLKADFPSVEFEVIDYTSAKVAQLYAQQIASQADPQRKQQLLERRDAFAACPLPLSEKQWVTDDFFEVAQWMNAKYDAVIVGSDAVWNWITRGFPNLFFLRDYHGKKLSYAASAHGLRYRTMLPAQRDYLRAAFADFSYLGVRDETTRQMLLEIDPRLQPQHNCDPSFLLDLDALPVDMEALQAKLAARGLDLTKPMLGIMGDEALIGRHLRRHFAGSLQLVALYQPNRWADVYLHDLTPFEWARVFSLFRATVTHFFHGTLFSLHNAVPVFPTEPASAFSMEYKTKILDVLERLDLTQWRTALPPRTLADKVLRKLGAAPNRRQWQAICAQIDALPTEGQAEMIRERTAREAESYAGFRRALAKCLEE